MNTKIYTFNGDVDMDRNEQKIANRVAKSVTATGKWVWEIAHISRTDGLFQLIYDSNAKSMKWPEVVKVMKELNGKVNDGLTKAQKEGLPLDITSMVVGVPEIVEEVTLKVFVNVAVKWNAGVENLGHQDVEEMMTEAGLL